MDYRPPDTYKGLYYIYNSRNFKWTIDEIRKLNAETIYNSRNFKWTIDEQNNEPINAIYNSRNFKWTIDL